MKKIIGFIICFAMLFSMISIIPTEAGGAYYLDVGETMYLYSSVTTGKDVKSGSGRWYSAGTCVGVVSDVTSMTSCKIQALAPTPSSGQVVQFTFEYWVENPMTGYRYLMSGYEDFVIIVNEVEPTSISVSPSWCTLDVGDYEYLAATVSPSGASGDVTWSSNDTSVATVSEGTVRAVGVGNATITARTTNGLSSYCSVTVNTPSLTLSSVSPTSGSSGVAKTAAVKFTYNTSLEQGSSYSSIKLYDNTASKSVTITKSISGKVLTLTPSANLSAGHNYTATVPASALENAYGEENSLNTTTFTVTAVKATGVTPASGSTAVALKPSLKVTFDDEIEKGTNWANIKLANASGTSVTYTASVSGNVLTVTPKENLDYDTKYTFTVPAGAVACDGADSTTSFTSNFTTAEKLALSWKFPNDNDIGISKTEWISFNFNQNILSGTKYSSVKLYDNTAKKNVTVTKTIEGTMLTLTPSKELTPGHSYTATVPVNGVKSESGIGLENAVTTTFKVAAVNVTGATLVSGATNVEVKPSITITFDDEIEQGSAWANITLKNALGETIAIKKTISGNELIVTPSTNMDYYTMHTLTVPSGAVACDGADSESSFVLTFTTKPGPLEVASITPEEGAIDVSIGAVVKIKFNYPIYEADNFDSINLINAETKKEVTGMATIERDTLIFTPDKLSYESMYELTVPESAVSNGAGDVNGKITTNFDTAMMGFEDVSKPVITVKGSTVAITAEEGASIYYTVNGGIPDLSGELYTKPFTLTEMTNLIWAVSVKNGAVSEIAEEFYVLKNSVKAECLKTFGGSGSDYYYDIAATEYGYVAVGHAADTSFETGDWAGVAGNGGIDAIIVKYDTEGNVVWKKNFGGSGSDYYHSVTVSEDGYVAVGYSSTNSFSNGDWAGVSGKGDYDAIIVKYDTSGNVVWKKNFGGSSYDRYNSVTASEDGYIAVGYAFFSVIPTGDWEGFDNIGSDEAIMVKYDTNGNVVWKKNFGGSGYDEFFDVAPIGDGFITVGWSNCCGTGDLSDVERKGSYDAIIVKYDTAGNVVWKKSFGGSDNDYYNSIAETNDGYVAVGHSYRDSFGNGDLTEVEGKGWWDAIVVKYDNSGNVVWKKNFGGSSYDRYNSVTVAEGGFVAVGCSGDFGNGDWTGVTGKGNNDAIIVKYDTAGNVVWKKNFGGSAYEQYNSVTADEESYVAVGYSYPDSFGTGDWTGVAGKGEVDAIIVKYSLSGGADCNSDTVALVGEESIVNYDVFGVNVNFNPKENVTGMSVKVTCPEDVIYYGYATAYNNIYFEETEDGVIVTGDFVTDNETLEADNGYTLATLYFLVETESNTPITLSLDPDETFIANEDGSVVHFGSYENYTFNVTAPEAKEIFIIGKEEIIGKDYYEVVSFPDWVETDVEWSVKDASTGAIDEDGLLTPLKNGTITIVAKDKTSGLSTEFNVTASNIASYINSMEITGGYFAHEYAKEDTTRFIYVEEGTTSIKLKASFDNGSITSDVGSFFNGVNKTINTTSLPMTITLTKKSTGYVDSVYTITILEENSCKVEATAEFENGKIVVNTQYENYPGGINCVAVYSGDVMVECYCPEIPYDWQGATITMYAVGDRLKLMVVKDLESMTPLCEAVEIDLTK